MLAEVQEAKQFFRENYTDKGLQVPPGDYAVPTYSSKGKCFMRVVVDERQYLSSFELFWDKQFKIPYSSPNPKILSRICHSILDGFVNFFRLITPDPKD